MILVGCVPGDFHGTCIRGKCARENWSILDKNDRDAKIRLFILYVTITEYLIERASLRNTSPPNAEVALKPRSLGFAHASALPLPGMAARQSLFELSAYQKGQRVLIHGVGGNVGSLAAQFAKKHGAFVCGTDFPEKAGHISTLGVDRFIDLATKAPGKIVPTLN